MQSVYEYEVLRISLEGLVLPAARGSGKAAQP